MNNITKQSKVFKLISDIESLTENFSADEISQALEIQKSLAGKYKNEIVKSILDRLLEFMEKKNNVVKHIKKNNNLTNTNGKKTLSPGVVKETEYYEKELQAILNDSNFISSKDEILELIDQYFKPNVTVRKDKKDSKNDLINKTVGAFNRMDENEKTRIFKNIRTKYMRNRGADFSKWAEIITKEGGYNDS